METLKSILAPYLTDQFLTQDWTQQAVYIPDRTGQKFRALFSWKMLNHLLNFHRVDDPNLRFSMDGKALPEVDRAGWHDRFQQGATLIINSVDELVPTVAELVAAIRVEMGHPAQVNLYCSPAHQQGFETHYDSHDVFILQIEGEKNWFVFRDTVPYPLPQTQSAEQLPPDEPPYLQCTLNPGDVLYIPRGHWHYAIAGDYPSLHLTLGIHGQTGVDWLAWLIGELQTQPEWRQNLPLLQQGSSDSMQQQLEILRQQLNEYLQKPDVSQRYCDHLISQIQPISPFSFPAQLGIDIFNNGLETRFVPPKFQRVQIDLFGETHHQITIGSKQITLKGLPDELVAKLFHPAGFSILDLADWAPDLDLDGDVVPLLTRLVTEGVLLVED
uniref:Transcription factor jumonji jmjC domain-containing protein n=1 Tax=Oscillatoriales cyanobacterium SpSt-402 TaxID=2282168 RepID=A0A832M247_9CYAN